MTFHQVHDFLLGIHYKIAEQEKIAATTGENFNMFRILGVEAYEVSTHSAFLGELLNPRGTHGQGSQFLRLFLASFAEPAGRDASFTQQIKEFHAESATLTLEEYIGRVDLDYTEGGKIDITLTDSHNRRIFIENKIKGGDEKNQLRRYHRSDKKAAFFYLTLEGMPPSKFSLGDGEPFYVHPISYKEDILHWLLQCRKEAATLPGVRETLTQYIELIRYLTNQTASKTMKEEIKKMVAKNPDYIDAIDTSWESLGELRSEAERNFREMVQTKLAAQVKPIPVSKELSIEVYCAEDAGGFYIGYRLMDGKANQSDSKQGRKFAAQLRTIDPRFIQNPSHVGWHSPIGFAKGVKVQRLDKHLLVQFYLRGKELEDFTEKIVRQERDIRNALEQAIISH